MRESPGDVFNAAPMMDIGTSSGRRLMGDSRCPSRSSMSSLCSYWGDQRGEQVTLSLQFFTWIFSCESTNAVPCFAGLPCNLGRIVLAALDSPEPSKGNATL